MNTRGVVVALLGVGTLSAMDAVAKLIVSGNLHLAQIMAVRSVVVITLLVLVFGLRGDAASLRPVRFRAQLLRAAVGLLAPVCFFASLRYLPLTDATVVAYSSVFIITLLSALILAERVGKWRWSAITVGFVGVAIALEPTGEGSALGYGLVLMASVSYSALAIGGKLLGATERSSSLVLTYNTLLGVTAGLWLPWVWQPMSGGEIGGIVLFGLMAVTGQLLLTGAYRRLDGSLVAPLEYTSLLWVVTLDFTIWQDAPGARTLLGALIIIGASLVVIHREHVNASASAPTGTTRR
mgnify:CR=1 FL=1